MVIAAGAGGLSEISASPEVLAALRHSYADAVRWTMLLALASVCIAVPSSCAMEWLNIKKIAAQRAALQETMGMGSNITMLGVPGDAMRGGVDKEKYGIAVSHPRSRSSMSLVK